MNDIRGDTRSLFGFLGEAFDSGNSDSEHSPASGHIVACEGLSQICSVKECQVRHQKVHDRDG